MDYRLLIKRDCLTHFKTKEKKYLSEFPSFYIKWGKKGYIFVLNTTTSLHTFTANKNWNERKNFIYVIFFFTFLPIAGCSRNITIGGMCYRCVIVKNLPHILAF